MKYITIATLAVLGVFLCLSPALYNYMLLRQIADRPGVQDTILSRPMGDIYTFVCWLFGGLLILLCVPAGKAVGKN